MSVDERQAMVDLAVSGKPLPSPTEAYFEVANRSNSKCATCPLTFSPQEGAKQLSVDEFQSLVAQMPDLRRAVMQGIGEPLLNRDLAPMTPQEGVALLRDGRLADAEAALRRAADIDETDWSARFAPGTAQYQQDRTEEALANWRAALALDPPNFTVRKQIWMVEHPEKFYPTIDFGWQKEQLERDGFTR